MQTRKVFKFYQKSIYFILLFKLEIFSIFDTSERLLTENISTQPLRRSRTQIFEKNRKFSAENKELRRPKTVNLDKISNSSLEKYEIDENKFILDEKLKNISRTEVSIEREYGCLPEYSSVRESNNSTDESENKFDIVTCIFVMILTIIVSLYSYFVNVNK